MKFDLLEFKLENLEDEYKVLKQRAQNRLKIVEDNYSEKRKDLLLKIKKVCPHKEEQYHDTWHPHTRDGDQYYECKLCGNKRYV